MTETAWKAQLPGARGARHRLSRGRALAARTGSGSTPTSPAATTAARISSRSGSRSGLGRTADARSSSTPRRRSALLEAFRDWKRDRGTAPFRHLSGEPGGPALAGEHKCGIGLPVSVRVSPGSYHFRDAFGRSGARRCSLPSLAGGAAASGAAARRSPSRVAKWRLPSPAGRSSSWAASPPTAENSSRVDAYSPARNSWRRVADLPLPSTTRWRPGIEGGSTSRADTGRIAELSDALLVSGGAWKRLPPMPEQRAAGGAAIVKGKLYVVGGRFPDPRATSPGRHSSTTSPGGAGPEPRADPARAPRRHRAWTGASTRRGGGTVGGTRT